MTSLGLVTWLAKPSSGQQLRGRHARLRLRGLHFVERAPRQRRSIDVHHVNVATLFENDLPSVGRPRRRAAAYRR